MKKIKINWSWILKTLPKTMSLLIVFFAITSSFEAVLNGYVIGQVTKVSLNDVSQVTKFLLTALLAYLITYLSIYAFLRVKSSALKSLNLSLKGILFEDSFTKGVKSSDALNQINTISKQINQNYFDPMFMVIQVTITIISSALFILKTNLVLGTLYILLSFLSFLPSLIGSKQMNYRTNKWQKSNSKLIATISDIFRGHQEILNFGVKKYFFNQFKKRLLTEENNYQDISNYQYLIQLFSWFCALLTFLFPIALGIYLSRFTSLGITPSIIVTLVLTSDSVVGGVRELTSYQSVITGTGKIRMINIEPMPQKTEKDLIIDVSMGLNVSNLTVDYGSKIILKKVNFHINNGDKALITGPSGIGKSTLIKAISGQIKNASGKTTFDGHLLTTDDYVYIAQSTWLFNGSLRDNLTLFESFNDDQLIDVLNKVNLTSELGNNPLDFIINEDGKNVSGGQAQRIAIARGLLRNKPLFILDEVTASLDRQNADQIHQILYHLPVTMLEVAHNFDNEILKKDGVQKYVLDASGIKRA